jgi:hypothetical protein
VLEHVAAVSLDARRQARQVFSRMESRLSFQLHARLVHEGHAIEIARVEAELRGQVRFPPECFGLALHRRALGQIARCVQEHGGVLPVGRCIDFGHLLLTVSGFPSQASGPQASSP